MPAVFGDHSLSVSDRPFPRLAVIAVLVAALGLAGCGRKGPLDPPPSASAAPATSEQTPPSAQGPGLTGPASMSPFGSGGGSGASSGGASSGPAAQPTTTNQKFFLDPLLN